MNLTPLNDKVVLITGSGSGLGEATAKAFAAEGSSVVVSDVNARGAERVRSEIVACGGSAVSIPCDVSQEGSVRTLIDEIVSTMGRIDVTVNNAAVDHTVSVDDMSVAQWDQVTGVNLRGPFLVAKAALPFMKSQGYGHIVNIASTAATRAWANAAAYHASKWGLIGFGRALGVEGRPHGIRVTTIIPGGMKTHFFDRFESQGIPMPDEKDLQDPANVARVILCAVQMPADTALQEAIVTPVSETSWP